MSSLRYAKHERDSVKEPENNKLRLYWEREAHYYFVIYLFKGIIFYSKRLADLVPRINLVLRSFTRELSHGGLSINPSGIEEQCFNAFRSLTAKILSKILKLWPTEAGALRFFSKLCLVPASACCQEENFMNKPHWFCLFFLANVAACSSARQQCHISWHCPKAHL